MRRFATLQVAALAAVCVLGLAGCGDDDDGGTVDAAATDAAAPDARLADAGPDAQTPASRGAYLVNHVLACGDCHTPRLPSGAPDMTKFLSGVSCFIDIDPGSATAGCISTRNLTNHATGQMTRTDAQLKAMFLDGMRPNGQALHSIMPYYQFHNMTASDADAIVAYLRTVPGVDNTPSANQPPFDQPPPAAATPVDPNTVPMPAAGATQASAMRGRYLAGLAGACLECHTPDLPPGSIRPIDMTKPFAGGKDFPAALLGLPSPPFPANIYSANLTPHATTGLMGYDAAKIVRVLKQGRDSANMGVCPPMPVGPMAAFGGLTDGDAMDIANYILSLPAVNNMIPGTCAAQ